jgi:hypothetical protein
VQFDGDDSRRLASRDMTIVSCPRSNQYVGVGAPPLEAFYAMDVERRVRHRQPRQRADLNLFRELASAPRSRRACRRGAARERDAAGRAALGFGTSFGTHRARKARAADRRARPGRVDDVEEYLCRESSPRQAIRLNPEWIWVKA